MSSFPRRSAAAVATLALAAFATQASHAAPPWSVDPVVGLWLATVTQRNCATGEVLAVFQGQQVFHHGGTLSDTNSGPPTSRGVGFGTWQRTGPTSLTVRFRFMRFGPDGQLAGFSLVTREVALSADGQSATAQTTVQIQNPAGVTVATGCASDVAARQP